MLPGYRQWISLRYGRHMKMTPLLTLSMLVAATTLTACGDSGTGDVAAQDGDSNVVKIVASTNVYGDIAQAVAGDEITVTSIITSSTQDPHEYEASARDRLTIESSDIVIENGGGYDPFIDALLESSDASPIVLTAVDISGLLGEEEGHEEEGHDEEGQEEEGHEGHGHIEGFNEHVWYDFHTVEKLAEQLRDELSQLDPDNAATYDANYESFAKQVENLEAAAEDLKTTAAGQGVAITEPVPVYLLAEVGLENLTPDEFSESVEEGADVPPRALQETLDLFDGGEVSVLAYNQQTSDATTEQVRAAAESADVPVVDFTETLPDGLTYIEWQQANLDNLSAALGQ